MKQPLNFEAPKDRGSESAEERLVSVEDLLVNIDEQAPQEGVPGVEGYSKQAADTVEEIIANRPEEMREFFRPFEGEVVVDIGPGNNVSGYHIACAVGASGYIGVEPVVSSCSELRDDIADDEGVITYNLDFSEDSLDYEEFEIENIPAAVVNQDGHSFLRRVSGKEVSVFASALDATILQDLDYAENLEQEISRVLSPQGGFASYLSILSLGEDKFEKQTSEILNELEMYVRKNN